MTEKVKQAEILKCNTRNCHTIPKVNRNTNTIYCDICKKEIKK